MKLLTTLLASLFICTVSVSSPAQNVEGDLAVVKFSWERERLNLSASVAPLMSQEELTQQSRRERQLAAARNTSDRATATRLETETLRHEGATAQARQTPLPKDGYRYKVSLRNDSSKTIKSIDWDYIFFDPQTDEMLRRHQFTSDETIKPGKTKEISVLYLNPPLKTVTVRMLVKKDPLPAKEQVIVSRIEYTDGSVWHRP